MRENAKKPGNARKSRDLTAEETYAATLGAGGRLPLWSDDGDFDVDLRAVDRLLADRLLASLEVHHGEILEILKRERAGGPAMSLTDAKVRLVINQLADPGTAHAAAHVLAEEAKRRKVLVADLVAESLAPTRASAPPPPKFSDVDDDRIDVAIGKRINASMPE